MSRGEQTESTRGGVVPPDARQLEFERPGEALGGFLARLAGRSCVLPFQRVQELAGGGLPEAAMSVAWWTDVEGWPASAAAPACLSAGWRLDSVTNSARFVRFVRVGGDAGRVRGKAMSRPPRAGSGPVS